MRILRCALLPAVAAAGVLLGTAPARAQMDSREGIALQNQILQLRRDLQVLQGQTGAGGGGSGGGSYLAPRSLTPPAGGGAGGDLTAQLLSRVQVLEDQVRQLRGQMDELTNTQQRQNAELAKQIGDLNFALQQGGGRSSATPPPQPQAPAPPPSSLGGGASSSAAPAAPSNARRTPEMSMQEGYAALSRRDYQAAEAAAREVLQGSRTSPRAYDAQYLLAQSLAGQRNYAQAAVAFDDTYNRSKTGSHAADALLGLASSLTDIGEKRAACDTLTKLASEFPRQAERGASIGKRAGCR